MDFEFRFGGIRRLLGQREFEKILKSHICIIGLGGVGSWCAEALCRSAVPELTLVDYDDICESNINRQIHALDGDIGKQKIDVMKERLERISPEVKVHLHHERFDLDSADSILSQGYSVIVDATDQLNQKCVLISECVRRGLPLIVVGATAGKSDPTLVRVDDLAFSQGDRLLQKTRRKLRSHFGFPRNPKDPFGVRCVFSREQSVFPLPNGEVSVEALVGGRKPLDCNTGMGSISFLTGTFGFTAASEALRLVRSR